jgi:hypothetical protein
MVVADKKGASCVGAVHLTLALPQFATSVSSYITCLQTIADDSPNLDLDFGSSIKVKYTLLLCQTVCLEVK